MQVFYAPKGERKRGGYEWEKVHELTKPWHIKNSRNENSDNAFGVVAKKFAFD